MYGGVPPPPPSAQPASLPSVCPAPASAPENLPLALAPPPGFSDSEHSLSDTDSLGSEPNNFQRFGFSRVSKPRSLAVARQDRMMPQVNNLLKLRDKTQCQASSQVKIYGNMQASFQ